MGGLVWEVQGDGQEGVQEVQVGRQVITWSASQLKKNGRLNLVGKTQI